MILGIWATYQAHHQNAHTAHHVENSVKLESDLHPQSQCSQQLERRHVLFPNPRTVYLNTAYHVTSPSLSLYMHFHLRRLSLQNQLHPHRAGKSKHSASIPQVPFQQALQQQACEALQVKPQSNIQNNCNNLLTMRPMGMMHKGARPPISSHLKDSTALWQTK